MPTAACSSGGHDLGPAAGTPPAALGSERAACRAAPGGRDRRDPGAGRRRGLADELRLRARVRPADRRGRAGRPGARRREGRPDPVRHLPARSFREAGRGKAAGQPRRRGRTRRHPGRRTIHHTGQRALSDRTVGDRRPLGWRHADRARQHPLDHRRKTGAGAYLGLTEDRVRILSPLVGGAFGSKSFLWMHVVLCAVAARAVGRPVKLVLTRNQMFSSTGHRPRTEQQVALVAGADGSLLSTEQHTLTETSTVAHFCEPVGLTARFLYASPRMVVSHTVARINAPTPCFMRGPGEAPGMFALEVAMDELAEATGTDPVTLRLHNDPACDQPSGRAWSGKHLRDCYLRGAERFGWSQRSAAPRTMRRNGIQVGWGMATASYPGRRMASGCRVVTTADGQIRFAAATHEIGTGVRTVMAQVGADATGMPLEAVTFESGDSLFPDAPYSGASQTTATVGSAVALAGRQWRRRLGRTLTSVAELRDVLSAEPELRERLTFTVTSGGPDETGPLSQSFGAHFCEVEVDEEIGRASVTRWTAVMDCGRVLNPKLAANQVMGGITFGLGMALLEQVPYDERTGQLIGEYYLPTHADRPDFDITFIDVPDYGLDPIGVRGIGEIGTCGVPAAIANAVYHATGKRLRDLPITLESLLQPFEPEPTS
ncbi:xanthine dehydrogenase family protein molybdopterin-binding subunit [Mycolicibacterium frederiksbergense]|uniref:xanthine dehydrogenase family protein molybdopterin-binding subunit n=1 Tax=Mycolicibacterium frederiksbergense TaxID=117567 RepID=UPI0027E37AE4|nr:xanthine dehydrogenase family protein molybdopterin-binding subunit [Mycolicibacterium frederiksbergense]